MSADKSGWISELWTTPWAQVLRHALVVGSVIFAVALLGIFSRPVGFLAAIWPANALLLGMLLRAPRLTSGWCWLAAFIALVLADLLTGGKWLITLWLTAANLAGVGTAFWLYSRFHTVDRTLQSPPAVLHLFVFCFCGALASALVGCGASIVLFDRDIWIGLAYWFSAEMVNYITILPVVLTFPLRRIVQWFQQAFAMRRLELDWLRLAPLFSLAVSLVVMMAVGGSGAIALPVPALLWCALSYSLFTTMLVTLIFTTIISVALARNLLPVFAHANFIDDTVSLRLGLTMLALGPLTVACINAARNKLVVQLDHAVNHDYLTDALSRATFEHRAGNLLKELTAAGKPVAMLMMDLDHFKYINDHFGHRSGDLVLIEFARLVDGQLRKGDLFGRLGGEEFAVMLPGISREGAAMVAERLRSMVAEHRFAGVDGKLLKATVSIGVGYLPAKQHIERERLLVRADEALYLAKNRGRNQVQIQDVQAPAADKK
ncbi:diguanylate cyclase [Pokkaliibacter sp. MBI-7]|uniref:GGDEF domain-containing protein n=1 Tax=Pokkaliibacter sp. MBI-7 TaxID=3040600 RepID=UPI00244CF81D|nr:diguanylate cyclase [Pokkaliibacter sp. MBI-7]MDH2435990.1 diguanylate cyclase [Pokkaliibacter sp. MBI-7]